MIDVFGCRQIPIAHRVLWIISDIFQLCLTDVRHSNLLDFSKNNVYFLQA